MANLVELNEGNFEIETAKGVTLIDFWAPWCGPCKMLGPILEKVAEELGDKAQIAKVNVDDSPKLAQKFNVRSIPAIFILKNGKTVKQFVGLQDKSKLIQAINSELE
jgi:thioredoxin 1